MSLNHFTEIQKGLDLKLKIGCESLEVKNFIAPQFLYAVNEYDDFGIGGTVINVASYSNAPTNLKQSVPPQILQTNAPDRYNTSDPNGIEILQNGIYNVEISFTVVANGSNTTSYIVEDQFYTDAVQGISNYLQQSVITTMHFNTTKQYAVGDVISPLLIDLIGQPFAIVGHKVFIRFVSSI
jgi:hypothetical protein